MALTAMATFRIEPELKMKVEMLAKRTKRSAGFYYNQALEQYFEDIEDLADAKRISSEIKDGKQKTFSLESVIEELGL